MWDASAILIMETGQVSETSYFGLSLTKAIAAEDLVHIFNKKEADIKKSALYQ
jgi:hypothetical protein